MPHKRRVKPQTRVINPKVKKPISNNMRRQNMKDQKKRNLKFKVRQLGKEIFMKMNKIPSSKPRRQRKV